MRDFHVLLDDIELSTLLMHHVRHIAEQLVQLTDRLLDVADLGLALDDELFLEVDVVLVRQTELLLLLLLLLELGALLAGGASVLEGGARGRVGCFLLLDGLALELLKLGEGGFKLAAELGLGKALGGLSLLA
jgi:TRAP-type mannitol/chloroaromatic compound transport system permease large subunit